MRKEFRTVDVEKGIVQITSADERWYAQPSTDPVTGLPNYDFVPSVTWIADHYPKGTGFYKWLADKGWDEAEAIKQAAGDKGSKVHRAIVSLLNGNVVGMEAQYPNPTTEQLEPLTLAEYECLMSFVAWHAEVKPIVVAQDITVWNPDDHYAGTLDLLYRLSDRLVLVDFKTSQSVWPPAELQVSAYAHTPQVQALVDEHQKPLALGILQLGYLRNKAHWKFTEVADQFDLFLAAQRIWRKETAGQFPKQKDYPLQLTLTPVAVPTATGGFV